MERSNDSFIDDTLIGLTAKPLESYEDITERMNNLANKYNKYLNLSGGRLAVHKCVWYFLAYKRKGDKTYPITIKESPYLKVSITEAFSGKNTDQEIGALQVPQNPWGMADNRR